MEWISSWFGSGNKKEPTEDQKKILLGLRADLTTQVSESNSAHEELLMQLWKKWFVDAPYEKTSKKWKELGFQRDDPRSDFRGGGVLSLHCILYYMERYQSEVETQIRTQAPRTEYNYPWAAVGINIARLLCDLFKVPDGSFASAKLAYWHLLTSANDFFEMYCAVFALFDRIWTARRATYMQFGAISEATKTKVLEILQRSSNLSQFVELTKAPL